MKLSLPTILVATVAAGLLISGDVVAQSTNNSNSSSSITVEITLVCATVAG